MAIELGLLCTKHGFPVQLNGSAGTLFAANRQMGLKDTLTANVTTLLLKSSKTTKGHLKLNSEKALQCRKGPISFSANLHLRVLFFTLEWSTYGRRMQKNLKQFLVCRAFRLIIYNSCSFESNIE